MVQLNTYFSDSDISKYLRTDQTFKLVNIEIHLADALRTYIYPALSESFTDSLMTEPVEAINDLLKSAIINFAAETFYDMLPLNASNTGAWEHTPEQQKPIRLEVLDNAQQSRLRAGHRDLDYILKYLEGNLSTFSTWTETDEYKVFNQFRIKNTAEFNNFCSIRHSRGVMLCLRASMLQAEMLYIDPVAKVLDTLTLSDAQTLQADNLLKTAFANYSYSLGIWDLINTYGYDSLVSINNTSSSRQKGMASLALVMVQEIEKRKATIAANALNLVSILIQDNVSTLTEEHSVYENSKLSTVFNF